MFEDTRLHDEASRAQAPAQRVADRGKAKKEASGLINLDSPEAQRLHLSLIQHYLAEIDRHAPNRARMEKDERYYDGDHWTHEERRILALRGQMASSFNVIATTINWLIGTERRSRTDYKILPRRKAGARAAEKKTELIKYLSDVNRSEFAWSRAFASAVKVGVGWIESGWQAEADGPAVFDRYESWRSMLWDSYAQEDDLSDARYVFRTRWTDLDNAKAMFPGRDALLHRSADAPFRSGAGVSVGGIGLDSFGDSHMDSQEEAASWTIGVNGQAGRRRVRLIECWFKRPAQVLVLSGGDFSGELFDPYSKGHQTDVDTGRAMIVRRTRQRVFLAVMTPAGLLSCEPSPYRHNRFPFTPVWCYRRGVDGMPYGLIRGLIDIQDHVNKAASKAIHILSTNKVIMDEGAVEDMEAFADEVARPDAILVKKAGKEITLNLDRDVSQAHMAIMGQMIQLVQTASGVTDENVGRQTNAHSGKAIELRQSQGALATAEPFDNLTNARRQHGDKLLSLTEQFIEGPMEFRVTTQRGGAQFVEINQDAESDITASRADFIISEQAFNATLRIAKAEILTQFISTVAQTFPQIAPMTLDLVTELMDLPNGDEIVKRIRQATGMKDPDADPNAPLTPEEQEQADAKKAEAEMMARTQTATIEKLEAEAASAKAKAELAAEDAIIRRLDQFERALANALAVLQVPQAAASADAILAHAQQPPQPDPGPQPPMGQPPMGQPPMGQPQPPAPAL